jgi:hypothetical protein
MEKKLQLFKTVSLQHVFQYLILFVFICSSLQTAGCTSIFKKEAFFSSEDVTSDYVFFADSNGYGIRLFIPKTGNVQALTNENDDFPYYSTQQHRLFFIRRIEQYSPVSEKTNIIFHICSMSMNTGRVEILSNLTIYSPRKDRKDQLFFVEDGEKIVISPINASPFVVNTETGQKIPDDNAQAYYKSINQYDSDQNRIFGVTHTDPYQPYFQELEAVQTIQPQKTLFWWEEGKTIQAIQSIKGLESYDHWFFGYSWSSAGQTLYFSQNLSLYMWDGTQTSIIAEGVHPFTMQKVDCNKKICTFPFFRLYSWIQLENEEDYLFSENNSLSLYRNGNFHILQNHEFLGGKTTEQNPYYIFDHLVYLSELKNPKYTYILVSSNKSSPVTPDSIARGNDQPDIIKIFNLHGTEEEGTFDHTIFSASGYWDLSLRMEFLSSPARLYPEIILQYSASNFEGTERMQAAGRAIQWIDVYAYDSEENQYVLANQKFPKVYVQLLQQLESIYEFAIQSKRSHNPVMCDEDMNILEKKIKEARNLSRSF